MVFSSTIFVFFFLPVVLALYFTVPKLLKNSLLLCASFLFYAWGEGWLVLILLASTAFNYGTALLISGNRDSHKAITFLFVGVCTNLSLLGYYKYANFIVENYYQLITAIGFTPIEIDKVRLPIGISFFTFQSISYLVDVYRGTAGAQRRFVDAALYIAMFPQLIAGPIIRYNDVSNQLQERRVALDLMVKGTRRFVIGLGKKVLIANPLGFTADKVFSITADNLTWELSWLGVLCYTLQIYFDFSGYSDMAIGLGKFFGFRFLENFNYPYISRSIREFWRRWHISLSNWFRDYLYIPLGGNQAGICRLYINLVIVFLLCGLWHGANWTFVFWGLYHGLFLVLERIGFDRIINRLWQPFQHIYTLLVVIIGWVFFRSDDLVYSLAFLKAMFGMGESSDAIHPIGEYMTNELIVTLIVGAVASTGAYNWIIRNGRDLVANETKLVPNNSLGSAILAASEPIYLTLVFVIVLTYLAAGTYNPFIYFRF